jgi:hypothetical protein
VAQASDAHKAARKKLLEDFEFWAKHACNIRTKDGKIVRLVLNRVQQRFLAAVLAQWRRTGRVRMVVLKARQQGLSTVISAFQYWWLSQRKAQKGLVMAHEAESTTTLFDMYRRVHDNVPEILRPQTSAKSRNEMVFNVLDSALRVATAGGRGVARGETLQFTHLSEVAFWPTAFAAANFNGLVQAVPDVDDTFIFLESTAQGVTGKFYEMFKGSPANGYDTFFSAWFESNEYREKADANFARSPDEDRLAKLYGLDNDQLQWRRRKVAQNGLDLFKQEYPSTPDEAFISTGRPVFNPETLHERLQEVREPLKRFIVTNGALHENPRGELLVYRVHDKDNIVDPAETYTIGADVGMGVRNGDYSVAQILDSRKRQVAVWRGHIHPDAFATVLITLGLYFNSALLGPERNNHGLLTCVKLRDQGYPNIYTDVTEGALDDKDTIQIGHYTSERTKPLVIDKLRAAQREGELEINDRVTLEEMLTFVFTDSGKMEGEGKCHDDCVMSLAICNHIHEGRWEPVVATEDHYAYAI